MRKKVCTIKEIWSRNCTLGGLGDAPLLPKLYRLFVVMEYNDGNPINPVWVVWVLVAVDSPPCPDAVGSAPPPPPPNPPRPPSSSFVGKVTAQSHILGERDPLALNCFFFFTQ